jgi:hypothetical protein
MKHFLYSFFLYINLEYFIAPHFESGIAGKSRPGAALELIVEEEEVWVHKTSNKTCCFLLGL